MQQKLIVGLVLAASLILSVIIGSAVGKGDYVELSIYGVIGLAICYLTFAYQWTWQLILFLSFLGFDYYHGFNLEASHLSIALLSVYSMLCVFRGNVTRQPVLFKQSGSQLLAFLCIVWILYGIIHFFSNVAMPHIPNEFSMKNALKAYFMAFVPPALLLWMLKGPITFKLGRNWGVTILIILIICLFLDVIIMGVLFLRGHGDTNPINMADGTRPEVGFHIPVINAVPNPFALRVIAPLTFLFFLSFLTYKQWRKSQSALFILILLGSIFLALVGCVLSGGRAALLLAGFYGFILCVTRKKIGLIIAACLCGIMVIAVANVFSNWINRDAPLFVARPLQYVLVDKGTAMDSIEHSSDYRKLLYSEAILEWRSHPRILFVGRSIYLFRSDASKLRYVIGDEGAFLENNLRAGTCHALLPSALIQYGAIGTSIYYAIYVMVIVFTYRLYRRSKHLSASIQLIAFIITVANIVSIIVDTLGGGWFGVIMPLFIGLLRVAISREETELQGGMNHGQHPMVQGLIGPAQHR